MEVSISEMKNPKIPTTKKLTNTEPRKQAKITFKELPMQ